MSIADKRVWRAGMRHIQKQDPVLGKLVKSIGPIDFEMDDGHYEALVGAIIYQQLAGSAARAILDRFKKIYGGKIPYPKQYLSTPESKLRASGLSPQKISYIRDLCERIVKGSLDLLSLAHLSDEEAVERLDEIRGVGRLQRCFSSLFLDERTFCQSTTSAFRRPLRESTACESCHQRGSSNSWQRTGILTVQ